MASYIKPDDMLSEEQVVAIVVDAVPPHAYRVLREWTWTRSTGVWKLNLTINRPASQLSARMEPTSTPKVIVGFTRREVDAALRFLVAVGAIDRHPDDPTATAKEPVR